MANNPNVVVDAKMSDEQLLRSIDATLTRSEKKFTDFATDINATLGKIGEGFGKGMSNSFNTQVDAMSKKIKELEAQIKSVDGKNATTPSATPTVSTININDLNSYYSKLEKRMAGEPLDNARMRMRDIQSEINRLQNTQIKIAIKIDDQYKSQIDELKQKIKSIETEKDSLRKMPLVNNQETKAVMQQFKILDNQLVEYKKQLNSISKLRIKNESADSNAKPISALREEYSKLQRGIEGVQKGSEQLEKLQSRVGKSSNIQSISATTENLNNQDMALLRLNEHYKQLEISSKRTFDVQKTEQKKELGTAIAMPTNTLDEANAKLKKLQDLKNRISSQNKPLLDSVQIQRVDTQISNLTAKIEKLKAKINIPVTMNSVMGMSEKSLNDISAKMQSISSLRGNYGKGAPELAQLNKEYQRLSVVQREALSTGIQTERTNNKLATSFENLGRRVLFYTGLGAMTGFVRQLYTIRGEYEMLERSMGAIIGSFAKGSELFNQIQAQALKSPLTVIDLSSAAKQLIAYNFELNDIGNTTKRVADISSALGVPIERLVYNLGQIKSKGLLDARDARDFANAGLAIVPKLAEMYSNLNGKMVTTAEVYDMMSKKMVSYGDVMSVINGLTDDGGMFFDFQTKQAETLKGQLSNLTDAWNLMLNQMGEKNEGAMKGLVSLTRELFNNWQAIYGIVSKLVILYGSYKAIQLLMNATIGKGNVGLKIQIQMERQSAIAALEKKAILGSLTTAELTQLAVLKKNNAQNYQNILSTKALTKSQALWMAAMSGGNTKLLATLNFMGILSKQEIRSVLGANMFATGFKIMTLSVKTFAATLNTMLLSNPAFWIMALASVLIAWRQQAKQRNEEMANLNKSIADQSKQTVDDINKYIKDNQPTFEIVSKGKMGDAESMKLWDNLREEIEKTSSAATYFIAKLLEINDVQSRNQAAIEYLNIIRDTAEAMKGVADQDLFTQDKGLWGLGGEGLANDLKDFGRSYKEVLELFKESSNLGFPDVFSYAKGIQTSKNIDLLSNFKEAQKEIDATAKLITKTLNSQGIFLDENRDKFIEGVAQIKRQILEANPSIQGAMLDLFNLGIDKNFDSQEAAWDKFMQVLKNTSAAAFSSMSSDALKEWGGYNDESNLKLKQGIDQALDNIKKSSPMFYDEVKEMIQNAPEFKLRVGIAFNMTPLGDFQKDYMDRLKEAVSPVEAEEFKKLERYKPSGTENIDDWAKGKQEVYTKNLEEIDLLGKNDKKQTEFSKNRISQLTEENRLIDKSLGLYGLQGKEEEKANKTQTDKTDYQLQAIEKEIQLVEQLRKGYEDLTKAGYSNSDAISIMQTQYSENIKSINALLKQYGVSPIKMSDFAGISDADLSKILSNQVGKISSTAAKEKMSIKIGELTFDAAKYDMTAITEGLQNSLSNIKESYELGLEIEADPELGGLFSSMFGVDTNALPKNANEAIRQMIDAWNSAVDSYNVTNVESPLAKVDVMKTTPETFNAMFGLDAKSGMAEQYKKVYDTIYDIAKDDAAKTIQAYNDLNYKLADNAGKIVIEEQKLQDLQIKYAEETNEKKKALLGLQIEDQKNTIESLKAEAMKLAPFYENLFNDTYNQSAKTLQKYVDAAKKVTDSARQFTNEGGETRYELTYTDEEGAVKKDIVSLEEYLRITKQIATVQRDITNSNPFKKIGDDLEKDNIPEAISDIAEELKKASDAVGELSNMFKALGVGEGVTNTLDNITKGISGVAMAGTGIAQIASGDVIGGITNVLKGATTVINMIGDSRESKINKALKNSQNQVKDLQSAYEDLEYEMTNAMGNEETAIKRLQIVNQQLQLQELERQLQLEKSRKAKKRDEDAIRDLEGEINSLKNTIISTTDAIVNDMLGIASVKDAAFTMVDGMINAFKNGEDYMTVFNQSFDDMVDNMIAKAIYSSVIGDAFEELTKSLKDRQDERAKPIEDEIKDIESRREKVIQSFMDDYGIKRGEAEKMAEQFFGYSKQIEDKKKELEKASETTDEDIKFFQEGSDKIREDSRKKFDEKMALYGIKQGQDKDSLALSGLQQGIQGMTEEQGGAIEGYMNNLNGQVFKQGSILQEMLNISKVSLGGQSQMLLQMQQSYQVQMSMKSLMEGWTIGSGRAIRVEMV